MARPLVAGDRVRITKGCEARHISNGRVFTVTAVEELGPDYSHSVRVGLQSAAGRTISFYARHRNRLSDAEINLNDGNPLHNIRISLLGGANA